MRNAIKQYLSHLAASNVSEETVRQYRGQLRDFAAHAGDISVASLDVQHIEHYLVVLKERQLSKVSVARALCIIKSFFRWMTDEELLTENPAECFKGPRRPVHVRPRASEMEVRRLLEGPIRTSFPERDRLILELLYGCGLRENEVATIRVQDFREEERRLTIIGKGNKERTVPIGEYALAAMRVYLKKRSQILRERIRRGDAREITALFFGLCGAQINALSPRSIHRIVVKVAKDAGLPWLAPHDLRRAFATHMDQNHCPHIDISRLLGHARLSTTEIYIASGSPQRLKAAYEKARKAVA
jgi:integrase/recombinase XerC